MLTNSQSCTRLGTGEWAVLVRFIFGNIRSGSLALSGLPAAALAAGFMAGAHAVPPANSPAIAAGRKSAASSIAAGAEALSSILKTLKRKPELSPVRSAADQPGIAAAATTTTLSSEQLQSLPVNGRRWQDLFLDTPAATQGVGDSFLSLRGAGLEPADTTVDGASTRLAFGSGAAGRDFTAPDQETNSVDPSVAGSGIRGLTMSVAAIREVRVVAGNVEWEGTHAAGGRAGVETWSGGNVFHGQGFYSDRQNTWGAQNPFTQWVTQTAPASEAGSLDTSVPVFGNGPYGSPESYTPPDHEISWGLGAGGRIRRDKLFWFAALDSYHRNDPGLAMVKHPYLLDTSDCGTAPCPSTITGFFAQPSNCQMQLLSAQLALATAPGSSGDCVSGLYQGLTAYSQMLGALAGLLGPAQRTAAQWVGFARLDWQAAERHHLTLEGTGADWNSPGGGLTQLSENYGNHSFGSSYASQEWLLAHWEAFLTPNLLVVTQASAGRDILSTRPSTPSALEQTFLNSAWNSYGQLPEIVVDSRYGFTIGNPSRFGKGDAPDERLFSVREMVDWVRGKLLVKSGFEMDHNTDTTTMLRNQTGTYTYSKVENFISDALVFAKFGADPSNYASQHNCNPANNGLGALPCYSYFSQVIGPNLWQVSTDDWAGYSTAQWQLNKFAVFSAGLRWEFEQLPPPLGLVDNPQLPLTQHLPALGGEWGPRMSLALGSRGHWPVLRLGYGMYFGRTENASILAALTQTGSLKGDLTYFIRPTDGYSSATNTSLAPSFPNVLTGPPGSVVVPGATEYAPNFHNPEVHQAVAAVEQELPSHVMLTASGLLSLGRRLPVMMDANLPSLTATQTITFNVCDEAPSTPLNSPTTNGQCGNLGLGPIKAAQITVPFYGLWPEGECSSGMALNVAGQCGWSNPSYQQITQIQSRANSTYEAAVVRITRYGRGGLGLSAHYTYAHAMDWNPGESPLDPALNPVSSFKEEYGTSNLDVRHSAAVLLIYRAPWKLRNRAGKLVNGWMVSGIGQFHSGLPYTMRVSGSLAQEFTASGAGIIGLGPGMNGSGGDSRVYGLGSDGRVYNMGRNTFRYPDMWKADMRLGKSFSLGEERELQLLAESFNLFNHENVTEIETTGYTISPGSPASTSGAAGTLPTLNYLTGLKISATTGLAIPAFGQPLNINASNFYRERQIQFGARLRF